MKFKYENVVWFAFQRTFYSKTRLDGHITIREKSVFPRKLYLPARQVKNAVTSSIIKSSTPGLLPGHYSVYSLCTLFNIIWLNLWMPFYINNTFTRKYETNLPDEIIKIPVQVSFLHKKIQGWLFLYCFQLILCVLNCLK